MDDTVLAGRGDPGPHFVRDILAAMYENARRRKSSLLLPTLNLHEYERLFRCASRTASAGTVTVTPHMLRHGCAT